MNVTPVQRKVLRWLESHGGSLPISTGYKTVRLGTGTESGDPIVAGNVNLLDGLNRRKLIEPVGDDGWNYRLTPLARSVLSRMRPSP